MSYSLIYRVNELCVKHGGYRAAARVLKIDHAYLYRLGKGQSTNPSKSVLRKLGLKQVIAYERSGT